MSKYIQIRSFADFISITLYYIRYIHEVLFPEKDETNDSVTNKV